MAGETIRDVIIKVAIETVNSELKPIDTSRAADNLGNVGEAVAASIASGAESGLAQLQADMADARARIERLASDMSERSAQDSARHWQRAGEQIEDDMRGVASTLGDESMWAEAAREVGDSFARELKAAIEGGDTGDFRSAREMIRTVRELGSAYPGLNDMLDVFEQKLADAEKAAAANVTELDRLLSAMDAVDNKRQSTTVTFRRSDTPGVRGIVADKQFDVSGEVEGADKLLSRLEGIRQEYRRIAAVRYDEYQTDLNAAIAEGNAVFTESQDRIIENAAALERHRRVAVQSFERSSAGAIKLARGMAFLGLASEENTAKLVRGILQVQGVAEGIEGAYTMVTQLEKGVDSLVTYAAGAERAAGATTQLAGSTNSLAGGFKLLNPYVAAATAAVAASVVVAMELKRSDEATANALRRRIEYERQLKIAIADRSTEEAQAAGSIAGVDVSYRKQVISLQDAREQAISYSILQSELTTKVDLLGNSNLRAATTFRQWVTEAKEGGEELKRLREEQDALPFFDPRKFDGDAARLTASERMYEDAVKGLDATRAAAEKGLAIDQQRLVYQEAIADAIRSKQEAMNAAEEATRRQLENELQIYQVAVQTREEREAALQSINQQVGALDPREFAQLKKLSEKVKGGGTLNQREEEFLARNGGRIGREFVEDQQAARGRDRGADDVLATFDRRGTIGQIRTERDEAQNRINAAQDQFGEDVEGSIRQQMQESIDAQRELNQAFNEQLAEQLKFVRETKVSIIQATAAIRQATNELQEVREGLQKN